MQKTLKNRLYLLILGAFIFVSGFTFWFSYHTLKQNLLDNQSRKVQEIFSHKADHFLSIINFYKSFTLSLSAFPPVQGMLRASQTGVDPYDGSTIEMWQERFEKIARSILTDKRAVLSIRFLSNADQLYFELSSEQSQEISNKCLDKCLRLPQNSFSRLLDRARDHKVLITHCLTSDGVTVPILHFITFVSRAESQKREGALILSLDHQEIMRQLDLESLGKTFLIYSHEKGLWEVGSNLQDRWNEEKINLIKKNILQNPSGRFLSLDRHDYIYWWKLPRDGMKSYDWFLLWELEKSHLFTPLKRFKVEAFFDYFTILLLLIVISYPFVKQIDKIYRSARQEMIAFQKKYNELFENAPYGCALFSEDLRFLDLNPRLCEMTGYQKAELIGKPGDVIVAEEFQWKREAYSRAVQESKGSVDISVKIRRKNGTHLDVMFSSSYISGEGVGEPFYYCRVIDRTEDIQIKNKLVRSEQLALAGVLAAGVAHEINNPLQGIMTQLELLEMEYNGIKRTEEYQLVESGLKRVRDIIKPFMLLYRDAYKEKVEIDLNKVVKECLGLTLCKTRKNNLTIKEEFQQDLPMIKMMATEIYQIITNILINATDFATDDTSIIVRTFSHKKCLCLAVLNEGKVVDPDEIDKIFDPFYSTQSEGHMGIGLFISQYLAERNGGQITAKPLPEYGMEFLLQFPLDVTSS